MGRILVDSEWKILNFGTQCRFKKMFICTV